MSKKTDIVETMLGHFGIKLLPPSELARAAQQAVKVVSCSGRSLPPIALIGAESSGMTQLVLNAQQRFEAEKIRKAIIGSDFDTRKCEPITVDGFLRRVRLLRPPLENLPRAVPSSYLREATALLNRAAARVIGARL